MKANNKHEKTVAVLMVLLIGFFVWTLSAGNLNPPGPPASTMKTLDEVEARIPIPGSDTPAVTYIIDESGSYYLTGNRSCGATGIQVDVNDVTIDLNGYSLIGPNGGINYGIYMDGRSNVEIRNGTICNFGVNGIRENSQSGNGHRIENIRAFSHPSGAGVYLDSKNNLIKDCISRDNADSGIFTHEASIVIGNICNNNGNNGIQTLPNCLVAANICVDNGVGISASEGCTVKDNTMIGNDSFGIIAGAGSTITGNTAKDQTDPTSYGIVTGNNCLIYNNTATGNLTNLLAGAGSNAGENVAP